MYALIDLALTNLADVKMVYTKKKYEFQCNNYQLAVLLLFNEVDKW